VTGAAVLDAPTPLEDVADVRAFAIWQVGKSPLLSKGLSTDAEKEEAGQEAVALIFELHGDWDPKRCAKFSAWLLTMLPKRLVSWYRVELRSSGRGRWSGSTGEYKYNGMVSIDAMATVDNDHEAGWRNGGDEARPDSALTTYGPEDEAHGEDLEQLLAEVSGATA
jgi:DNA-directed RNA polymerase specialized sigma24 family protein